MRSKKALKNIGISLLLQITTIICGFIVPKLIIQSFGSNVNGLISSITQFLAYITLLESGVGPVIKAVLYKPIAEKDSKQIANILKATEKFFKTIAYIFIVYLVILCIIYPIIMNNQFDMMYTMSLVVIISISTFAEYYFGMTYRIFLQAEQRTYVVSGIQIITTIINTIMIVLLVKIGANIQIVKLISAIIFVFRPILQNIYVKKKYSINLKEADSNYKIEQKWDGLAQHIAAVVHGNTDITILTFLSSMPEVSVYSVYLLVVNGVKRIVQAFTGGVDASFGDMIAKGEKEALNKNFKIYELFYFTLITIIFICTIILIVPFIKLYTKGVTDANYIRPLFGFLIVLAEFIHSIRLPYSSITLAAGHFKETKKGAWLEAGINIVISIILVIKLGIIGVAIGTLVAMSIRTIEFIIHTSKYILERSYKVSFKWLFIIMLETIIVYCMNSIFFRNYQIITYINWSVYALIISSITSIVVLGINWSMHKSEAKGVVQLIKRLKK